MYRYERSVVIAAPIEQVFAFHEDSRNLSRISPPGVRMEVLSVEGPPAEGRRIRLRMGLLGPIATEVLVEFIAWSAPTLLVDRQIEGPFAFWEQTRKFTTVPRGTRLTDIVEYSLPFGILGRVARAFIIGRQIRQMFEHRQLRTKDLIEKALPAQS